ncbi:MAG: Gfo/Idh/MocA family oxidoreductase [Pirellulales bacterium]|nr:Gfo/Idh/MocA family oxidoreductase [Pirellulales bacterium]
MNTREQHDPPVSSRRDFLKRSGQVLAGTALAGAVVPRCHAAEDNTIKVALIGCGGRGTGAAANALSTSGPTKLWAMADAFDDRLDASLKNLSPQFEKQIDVPEDRRFVGLDAYRKAIDALDPGDVVLLATPPAFRPIHLEYAVERGRHVFMEKSFAVDAPGVRRVLRAGEAAGQKNLKIASGLMWRHDKPREEVIRRLHDGEIGEIHTLRTYRMHGPVGSFPKPADMSELAYQIRNYCNFTWTNASFFVDWLIHNIDVCCWAKDAWPVAAQGHGGRQVRTSPDQMFDHYCVEYTFADGAHLYAQARHMDKCWGIFSDFAHGACGSAVIMENLGAPKPRIYKNQNQIAANEVWRYDGPQPNAYQVEHDLLFDAIRQDTPYNEAQRAAYAAMASILGRMAAFSGQMVTWDEAMASDLELAPGLEDYTWDSEAPVVPDEGGQYPVAMPGVSKAF